MLQCSIMWYKRKIKSVLVAIDELALLCLSVDYILNSEVVKDRVEEISVNLQKKHKFDTHNFALKHDLKEYKSKKPIPKKLEVDLEKPFQ